MELHELNTKTYFLELQEDEAIALATLMQNPLAVVQPELELEETLNLRSKIFETLVTSISPSKSSLFHNHTRKPNETYDIF